MTLFVLTSAFFTLSKRIAYYVITAVFVALWKKIAYYIGRLNNAVKLRFCFMPVGCSVIFSGITGV